LQLICKRCFKNVHVFSNLHLDRSEQQESPADGVSRSRQRRVSGKSYRRHYRHTLVCNFYQSSSIEKMIFKHFFWYNASLARHTCRLQTCRLVDYKY